eukprot:5564617-Ditylum_brightwellii.AAC.1
MLQDKTYEVLNISTGATPKKAHMKANSHLTSTAISQAFSVPLVKGFTTELAIHHAGPVYITTIEQTKGHKHLIGIFDNWDQTHGIINKVSGATNTKYPNIKVAFLQMPNLLATYKTKYDAALKHHNDSQAAK